VYPNVHALHKILVFLVLLASAPLSWQGGSAAQYGVRLRFCLVVYPNVHALHKILAFLVLLASAPLSWQGGSAAQYGLSKNIKKVLITQGE